MRTHLELDLNNESHRAGLRALLNSLDGPAVGETAEPAPTETTPQFGQQNTPAPSLFADPEPEPVKPPASPNASTATEPATGAPAVTAPATPNAGVPDNAFPGTTDWAALDSKGTPYNDSIHTGTRTRNQDRTWRYKRGTDRAAAEALEARLREAAGTSPTQPVAPPPTGETATPPPVAPPPTGEGEQPKTFADLMRLLGQAQLRPTDEVVTRALADCGVASLSLLATQPAKVPEVHAAIFGE